MIYNKIKKLAKEKGVTIRQMEEDLGLSERNTCKWNESIPRVDTLKRVADYFGTTVDFLLQAESVTTFEPGGGEGV